MEEIETKIIESFSQGKKINGPSGKKIQMPFHRKKNSKKPSRGEKSISGFSTFPLPDK